MLAGGPLLLLAESRRMGQCTSHWGSQVNPVNGAAATRRTAGDGTTAATRARGAHSDIPAAGAHTECVG